MTTRSTIRVKICGIRSAADVELCVDAGADALGFIFADGPRQLTVAEAAELTKLVPPFVTCVGVFADSPPGLIRAAVGACRLDLLQFAGVESPVMRGSFGKPTIFVSRGEIPTPPDLAAAKAVAVLGDATDGVRKGGTGIRMDTEVARHLRDSCGAHFILAGGLNAGNVAEAIAAIAPDAVDARSGVERDGSKDSQLVRAFVRAAKEAGHALS